MRTGLLFSTVSTTVFVFGTLAACSSQQKSEPQANAATASSAATVAGATATSNSASKSTAPEPPAAWTAKMHSLSSTLSNLLPLVSVRSRFNDPKNADKIESETRQLASLAHSLKTGEKPSADPSLKTMSGLFEEDLTRALSALRSGNRDYARHILKDTTSYCIQCHTQTNNGPNFPVLSLNIDTSELKPLEQAEFFAATRQFDRSLEAYTKALSQTELAKSDPFEWENAVRTALAITVRVKMDPKQTSDLVSTAEKNKARPEALDQALKGWKKNIADWSKEKPAPKNESEAQKLKRAEDLIKRAQKRQEFPLDHSQDITYFRASSLLHDLLQSPTAPKNPETQSRMLYLAGIAAEATRDMNFWTLHETYYEQCIQAQPRSAQAKQCFGKLKESVTLGYSGSSGIQIPPEISRRLEKFRELAGIEKSEKAATSSEGETKKTTTKE